MAKRLYLKYFIFLLPLLSVGFYGYGMELDGYSSDMEMLRTLRQMQQGNVYNGYKNVKAETPFWDVIKFGIKQGAAQASLREALRVISKLLEILPYSVNKIISMIKIYSYKIAFGSIGLTGKDLTRCSNRIQQICSRFAKSQVGNLRKTKRATSIENEQDEGEDNNVIWKKEKKRIISELEHWVNFFRDMLPCYNEVYQSIDASIVGRQMASVLYALSTENSKEIYHYITRLIDCITDLINHIEEFSSLDNALEHVEDTKEKLTMIRTTAELISSFLADGNAKGSSTFQKLTEDTSSSKRDLMDILGNGALK